MSLTVCSACGQAALVERHVPFSVEHNGASRDIVDRQTYCETCHNTSYIGTQISEHEIAVASAIRAIDGLLSPRDLLNIRLKYHMKQSDMEQMLATGPKTWTRWERGKVPHTRATDKLIRLIAGDSEIARKLCEQAGVDNPEAAAIFRRIQEDAMKRARDLLKAELRHMPTGLNDQAAERLADQWFNAVERFRRDPAISVTTA
jgi:putative zinc finger/helix-turn-helix YgiT family protein